MSFPRFVVETRELAAVPQECDRRRVEEALRAESKKDVSATRAGDVTACADQSGTAVLVRPHDGRAEVRVTSHTAARPFAALGMGFAAAATLAVAASAWASTGHGLAVGAVAMAVVALLFLAASRISISRAKKRAGRVADAVVAALPRVRVEEEVDGDEHGDEEVHSRSVDEARFTVG